MRLLWTMIVLVLVFVITCEAQTEESQIGDKIKESYEKGYNEGIKKGLIQADSILNSLPNSNYKEQFNLGFDRAFFLNHFLIKKNLVLTDDEFWRLLAEIYYTVNDRNTPQKPISKHFESISFLPEKNYRDNYRFREILKRTYSVYRLAPKKYKNNFRNNFFVPTDTIRISNSNRYLVPMNGYGFENIPYIFSIFTIENGTYSFKGLLDSFRNVSIGGIGIKEIVTLHNGINIIIGESEGGDAGDNWGSLWFASFNNFFELKAHKSFGFSSGPGESQTKFEHSVNTKTNEVYVYTFKKSVVSGTYENFKYSDWMQTECDTINLNYLVTKPSFYK